MSRRRDSSRSEQPRSSRESGARRESSSRAEQKARTRSALIDAVLALTRIQGFSGLSLRDVARAAGIVPTAFYRHFASLDELGVVIAEEGMRIARGILREVRRQQPNSVSRGMQILADQVAANPDELRFILTERHTGPAEVRRTLNTEMRLLSRELAIDLARREAMRDWDSAELTAAAGVILSVITNAMAELVQPDADRDEIVESTAEAIRMIFVGLNNWRPARE